MSTLAQLTNNLVTAITARPATSTVTPLNDVTVICSPTSPSNADTTYSWHRVNGNIPTNAHGQDSNTLTIPKVVPADAGEYYCMAIRFDIHCAMSNKVLVIVDGKKMILV